MFIDVCLKSAAMSSYSSIMPSWASWRTTISGLPNAVPGTTTARLRFIFVIKHSGGRRSRVQPFIRSLQRVLGLCCLCIFRFRTLELVAFHVHMPRLYCSARLRTSYQTLSGRFHSLITPCPLVDVCRRFEVFLVAFQQDRCQNFRTSEIYTSYLDA